MRIRFLQIMKPLAAVLLVGGIAACSSDSTGANLHPVKLNVTSKVAGSAFLSNVAAANLTITKVQIVVDKVELNETESTSCVGEIEAGDDDHAPAGAECEDIERDPVLIDVPVDGSLNTVLNALLPVGTFSKLEAKIEPARSDATTFNGTNPTLVGKSIVVQGTCTTCSPSGTFTFTSSLRAGIEMSFSPPLVIDGITPTNATVSIDLSKWFLDSSGNVIDPNTATAGSAALQKIEDNIRRSFHAFEDDHESGIDDHGGHH